MVLFLMMLMAASPEGTWKGESLCTESASASCSNEQVVYYIRAVDAISMSVRAHKIVAGKAITMGEGPWKWDAAKSELRWDMPRQVWVLKVGDREIAGTLTLADGSVVRRMKLVRGE